MLMSFIWMDSIFLFNGLTILSFLCKIVIACDAPIVKWYNAAMVRLNCKFDSHWGHQSKIKGEIIRLFFLVRFHQNALLFHI